MNEVEIRRASAADRDALAALRRAWVEEQAGGPVVDPAYEAAFAAWFDQEQGERVTWLATTGDQPVGMVNLRVFTRMPRPGRPVGRWGYLANLYVDPGHRDAGTGGRLLAACTTYADEQGFVRIVLSPSERSRPLYERAGFGPADSLLLRAGPD